MKSKAKKQTVMEHLTERIVSPKNPPDRPRDVSELLSIRLPFDTFSSIEAVREHLGCTRTEAARLLLDAAWQMLREQVAVADKEQQKSLDEIKKRHMEALESGSPLPLKEK